MVTGIVYKNRPVVKISVGRGLKMQKIVALVDTGFTGRLKLPPKAALDLDILPDRVEIVRLANGKTERMFAGVADISMEGVKNSVEVLISSGIPAIGVGLLKTFDYNLNIDFKKDTLSLISNQ